MIKISGGIRFKEIRYNVFVGKHKWKLDQCMVCFVCGECTGYGLACVNSGRRKDRNPGM